jgi:hypothetical protein
LILVVSLPVVGYVTALLLLRPVAQQRPHVVQLSVARAGVRSRPVDFLHDDGGFRQVQPRATVLFGNQGRQPARLRQRIDECLGIATLFVDAAEVLGRKSSAEIPDAGANVVVEVGCCHAGFAVARIAAAPSTSAVHSRAAIEMSRRAHTKTTPLGSTLHSITGLPSDRIV